MFFARHGIPTEIVSDNMPFNSHEFLTFTKEWGILLTTSSPTYSQSNGQAERFCADAQTYASESDRSWQRTHIWHF